MQTLVQWLTVMSSSHVRALRHTSTFVALKILSKLCQVISNLDSINQLTGTKKKSKQSQKTEQVAQHKKFLHSLITDLYK